MAAAEPMSRERLFTTLALLLPVLFLLLLEGVLRLTGVAARPDLFVDLDGFDGWRTQNSRVAERYFRAENSLPTGIGDVFRAERTENSIRIVVQGGSSAAGYPYYYGAAFSRMLSLLLQDIHPDRDIEVINTAMAAVNSYTLLDFAPEIVAIQPDAVLIYAGHNEFYGALGVGSSQTLGRQPALVNAYLRLQHFNTFRLLERGLSSVAGLFRASTAETAGQSTLMERMVGEQAIPFGSDLYEAGLAQFEHNLTALIRTYREAGIPVFVSTVASNEGEQPPFIDSVDDASAYEAAIRAALQRRSLPALDSLVAAEPLGARAYFARGVLRRQTGDQSGASVDFINARNRDALRFRAPSAINDIIQSAARTSGATVLDGEAAMRQASPGGIVGSSLMLEHLHPNVEGYYVLAKAFQEAISSAGLFDIPADHPAIGAWRNQLAVTPVDRRFGELRLMQLQGSWPFQEPGVRAFQDTLTARTMVDSLALGVFRRQQSWQTATSTLMGRYVRAGQTVEAVRAARALQLQFPFLPGPNAELGARYAAAGLGQRALDYFERARTIEETPQLVVAIGNTHVSMNQLPAAETAYRRALQLDTSYEDAAIRIAALLAATGRVPAAVTGLRQFVEQHPDRARARAVLQQLAPSN